MLRFCIKSPLINIESLFKNNREFNKTSLVTNKRSFNVVNALTFKLPLTDKSANTVNKFDVPPYNIPLINRVFGLFKINREFNTTSPLIKTRLLKDESIDTTNPPFSSLNVEFVYNGFITELYFPVVNVLFILLWNELNNEFIYSEFGSIVYIYLIIYIQIIIYLQLELGCFNLYPTKIIIVYFLIFIIVDKQLYL